MTTNPNRSLAGMAWLGAVLILGVFLGACASSSATSTENLLAASGFRAKAADNAQRVAMMNSLPPYRLTGTTHKGKQVYLFADPKRQVVWVGGPAEYATYRRLLVQKQIADENMMAAQMNQEASMNWGMWGPWWW